MSFDQMMIQFSAPALCNIKPGNLFFAKKNVFSEIRLKKWKEEFSKRGLMVFSLQLSENSTAILVLNICWTRKILEDSLVQAYLAQKGYRSSNVFDVVQKLFIRMKQNKGFPHEVGVLLGYPIEDVIEFENHQGYDCKYCGYWKTYSDVETAKECQCKYKYCSGMCRQLYEKGYSLDQIVMEYKKQSAVA